MNYDITREFVPFYHRNLQTDKGGQAAISSEEKVKRLLIEDTVNYFSHGATL
jgi:hypothetical protein